MKVFVTGASGFLGTAIVAGFARGGHEVHGLVHRPGSAARVAALEALPVVGSMDDPSSYLAAASQCDILVHAAFEYSARGFELDRRTLESLLGLGTEGAPRVLLYTSGVWVCGDTGGLSVDELMRANPHPNVAQRVEHERLVLGSAAAGFRTLVLRPGCVYGGGGSLTAPWFQSATGQGAARIVGDGANHWAMVHRDDLGELYVRAAQSELSGQVLHAVDSSRYTLLECARAASRAAGAAGKVVAVPVAEAVREMGPVAECLAMDQIVSGRRTADALGWTPKHVGFVDGVHLFHASWRAAAGLFAS
jgi:nucleoside-diphosphate-sugar epimerase